jgi:predicted SAM-dependent methyltransferase
VHLTSPARTKPLATLRRFAKAQLSPGLQRAVRDVVSEWRIQRLHNASCRAAATLAQRPLRLNLASGYHPKKGWINVDLFAPAADLRLDLRRPLPFPDNVAQHIYVEHFFEHLAYPNLLDSNGWEHDSPSRPSEALAFLRECRRVLEPGGTLDIVVPDAEMILGEYVNRARDGFPAYPWWGPEWCDTAMHCVNYVFRQGREHLYAYDWETLSRLLHATGYVDLERRPFNPELDAPNHAVGSLSVIARKPQVSRLQA